jgi:hypothetical protein
VANGVAVHKLPCHRYIEDNPAQALVDGYRIPQGADPQQFDLKLWDGRRVYLNAAGGYWAEPTEAP